jgi:NAD(P)-dependent dehydrogenase (short-subunit alcohol dehydrogenase family)
VAQWSQHFIVAFAPILGRIVNVSSIAGKEDNPNACAYSVSKSRIIALTKSLGKELACTAIRVGAPASPRIRSTSLSDECFVGRYPVSRTTTLCFLAALFDGLR